MLTPMAPETAGLSRKSYFGKTFTRLPGYDFIFTFSDSAETRSTSIQRQTDCIEHGRFTCTGRAGDRENTIRYKSRICEIDFPFTDQRIEILESYLQYLHALFSFLISNW